MTELRRSCVFCNSQTVGYAKRFRRPALVLLVVALFQGTTAAVHAQQRNASELEQALTLGIAMGLPGVSVAVATRDGVIWRGTDGYSDVTRQIPVKDDDRFCIGSITKSFVAVIVLQLVQEGRIDLEKTPVDYLKQDVVRKVPNADKAKLRQLMNHTSGIPTWEFQPDWIRLGRGDRMTVGHLWGKTESLQYATSDKLSATNAPGVAYAYSNTNYTLLGLIVEAVTGNEVTAEIRRRILEPLGMKNTFMESFEDVPGGITHHYHYATPTFVRDAGVPRAFPYIREYVVETTAANLSAEWTAGGVVTSAGDLARYARALRDGALLGEAMFKEMFTYHPPTERPVDGEYLQGLRRIPGQNGAYTMVGHRGGTLGFAASMMWSEERDVIVVALTNIGSMHSGLARSPFRIFTDDVLWPAVMRYVGTAERRAP